jgi:hypothetical protein
MSNADTGIHLQRLRASAAITVNDLATRSGLGRATVIRALRGETIAPHSVWAIEAALKQALRERRTVVEVALNDVVK